MTIRAATPYLILNGRAQEALSFYSSALGARVEALQRFGDADANCPTAQRDWIQHAALRVGQALLMLSDGAAQENAVIGYCPVSVALDFEQPGELTRSFDQLAQQGRVLMPVFDAPWGSLFGVVADRFGVNWMLNCSRGHSAN